MIEFRNKLNLAGSELKWIAKSLLPKINPVNFEWMNEWYPSSMGFTAIYQHYGNQNKSI